VNILTPGPSNPPAADEDEPSVGSQDGDFDEEAANLYSPRRKVKVKQ